MADILTIENLWALMVLIFLQAVLGFDNLLYISIESQRAPEQYQARVRKYGILIAVALRIILLIIMVKLIDSFTAPFFNLNIPNIATGTFNLGSIVFLFGGAFIMYTAIKEIGHMLSLHDLNQDLGNRKSQSPAKVVAMIVLMNLVFSFDSILSAMAITMVIPILAIAIIVSGILMLVLADAVSVFLQKNRMFEVLGLFILLIVGVLLLSEGGHQSHLTLFGYPIEAMSKSTFYFSIAVMVLVDIAQSRYQRKLDRKRAENQSDA